MLLKIDTDEMVQGAEVASRLRQSQDGGIPWMTILDADGNELINSDGPHGNIGCPIGETEVRYFVAMIEKTAIHDPAGTAPAIAAALEKFAAPLR